MTKAELRLSVFLNASLGSATGFMTLAGLSWQDRIAKLCNIGDVEFSEWEREWKECSEAAQLALMRAVEDSRRLSELEAVMKSSDVSRHADIIEAVANGRTLRQAIDETMGE